MEQERDALGGDKHTVAFEEVHGASIPADISATIYDQQSVEGICAGLERHQGAGRFCVQQHPFHLKILTAGEKLTGAASSVFQHPHRLARDGRRVEVDHIQRLVDVQFPLFPVFIDSPVVVKTVCQVRTLLDLRKEDARTDGMNGSRLHEEQVVRLYWDVVKERDNAPVFYRFSDRGLVHIPIKAVDQLRAGAGTENIPHLRFAPLPLGLGIFVIRMHLDRQILLCVDELYQDRKFSAAACDGQGMSAEYGGMLRKQLRQGAVKGWNGSYAIRM